MGFSTNIAIGIQARSTSTRLPGKVFEKIKEKSVLEHVIFSAKSCASYLNRAKEKTGRFAEVFVLTPYNDPVAEYCRVRGVKCIEGSEFDVLSRYKNLSDVFNASYIVRITADCPFLPAAHITKAINTAIQNGLDYTSNVDPRFRTAPDGFDVEVISKRAMNWLDKESTQDVEREHVTLKLRSSDKPQEFSVGAVIGPIDLSHLKISIDTEEDLKKAIEHYESIENKILFAQATYGVKSVHRF